MRTPQEIIEVKRIQELSDELIDKFTYAPIGELPGILEARVMNNCPDMKSLSSKIKQNCIEIRERTDDEQIHSLTDSILFHLNR